MNKKIFFLLSLVFILLGINQPLQSQTYERIDEFNIAYQGVGNIYIEKILYDSEFKTAIMSDGNKTLYLYDIANKNVITTLTIGEGMYDNSHLSDFTLTSNYLILVGKDSLGGGIIKIYNKRLLLAKEIKLKSASFTSITALDDVVFVGTDNFSILTIDLVAFNITEKLKTNSKIIWSINAINRNIILVGGSDGILEFITLNLNPKIVYQDPKKVFFQIQTHNNSFYALNGEVLMRINEFGSIVDTLRIPGKEILSFYIDSCDYNVELIDNEDNFLKYNANNFKQFISKWESNVDPQSSIKPLPKSNGIIVKKTLNDTVSFFYKDFKNVMVTQIELCGDNLVIGQSDGFVTLLDTNFNEISKSRYRDAAVNRLVFNNSSSQIYVTQTNGDVICFNYPDLISTYGKLLENEIAAFDVIEKNGNYFVAYNGNSSRAPNNNSVYLERIKYKENKIVSNLILTSDYQIENIFSTYNENLLLIYNNGLCIYYKSNGELIDTISNSFKSGCMANNNIAYFIDSENVIYKVLLYGGKRRPIKIIYKIPTHIENGIDLLECKSSNNNKFLATLDDSGIIDLYETQTTELIGRFNFALMPNILDFEVSDYGDVYLSYSTEYEGGVPDFKKVKEPVLQLTFNCYDNTLYLLRRNGQIEKFQIK